MGRCLIYRHCCRIFGREDLINTAVVWFVAVCALLKGHARAAVVPEAETVNNRTLTLGLLVPFTVDWNVGTTMASAIIPAIEEVHERGLLPGHEIEWVMRDTGCVANMGFQAMVDLWQTVDDLDGTIGPFCSVVCQPVALLTAAFNIPTVSTTCTSSSLSDKEKYPTFVRVVGIEEEMVAPVMDALLDEFGWDRIAVVASTNELHVGGAQYTKSLLESRGKTVFYHVVNPTYVGDVVDPELLQEQRDVVRTVKEETRFVMLLMYYREIRVWMLNCYDEGMINGEYIYFGNGFEDMIYEDLDYRPEVTNDVLFEGMFSLTMRMVPGAAWDQLQIDVVEAFSDPRFDPYDVIDDPADVREYAGFLYDAVLLWAYGVNATLEEGNEPDDGLAVTNSIFNLTFTGGITGDVSIDHKGDRKFDQMLSIIQPGQVIELFFWHANDEWLEKLYLAGTDDYSGLYWGAGSTTIPSGVPECGWDNEFCPPPPPDLATPLSIGLTMAVVFVLTLVGLAVYMHKKRYMRTYEEAKRCVVEIEDISLGVQQPSTEHIGDDDGISDIVNLSQGVTGSNQNELTPGQTRTGKINGIRVSLRSYNNNNMIRPSDKKVLDEIITVKQISASNLNPFVCLSVNPFVVVIVSEYSPKGSVSDIIAAADLKLTKDLKTSLITDIVRGIGQLRTTDIKYHGHLKSTNCIVDNRWVCKLTDYGFHDIRSHRRDGGRSDVWAAPEILRGDSPPSQKGDIYAFGIIMQEILTAGEPYALNHPLLSMEETMKRVKEGEKPHYRPQLEPAHSENGWADLASSCWHEDPAERPTPSEIVKIIRVINGGRLPRLVDSMVQNLEAHTEKLEDIVEQRSKELREEQAKMDVLLNQLLPPSISEQLKRGTRVQPESFDQVSLFFSDIVGFTRVSAQSTPLQVVFMLNRLYSDFDAIVERYDVYKVATIGDAYMVASGVPLPNGTEHAREIASMALNMLAAVTSFEITHIPGEQLYLRIGLHSGPVVAGVTGLKTPRYLLFGETVDIGARIEAGGQKMRIHVSYTTADLLLCHPEYLIEHRGDLEINGVGVIKTYWLNGKAPSTLDIPPMGCIDI